LKIIQLDRTDVKVIGELKNVLIRLSSNPKVHQVIDIIVVDIPEVYGMFLSRDWSEQLHGYFATDWSHLWLPENGKPNKIRVNRERYLKFTVTDLALDGTVALPGPSLSTGPKNSMVLLPSYRILYTHSSLLSILFFSTSGIGTSPLVLPTTRDSNSRYPMRRDAETHDLAISQLRFPRVQVTPLRLPRSESPIPEYRYLAPREFATYETNCLALQLPRPDVPRFTCHVFLRKSTLPRKLEIATRDIDVHATLALANPDMPICDSNQVLLALKVNSFPGVQVVDSLPLEESFAPKLLPFGLHLGLFHNTS
jgi:hypothetical protein